MLSKSLIKEEWVNEVRLDLLLEGQASYAQGRVSFTGVEKWTLERSLLVSYFVPVYGY